MFIERAIDRLNNLPIPRRALALNALARSLLHSNLSAEEYTMAERALLCALDEPSEIIRRAVSDALANDPAAPRSIIHFLANDQFFVSEPVLEQSPVLTCAQLVDLVGFGDDAVQRTIAGRQNVSVAVAAALGEIASAEVCLILLRNPSADLLESTLRRIVERHGSFSELREELLSWPDLPVDLRHDLVAQLGDDLKSLIAGKNWMGPNRIEAIVGDATEKAVLKIFEEESPDSARALVHHLHSTDKLTAKLLIRAAVTGNIVVLEAGLAVLTNQPRGRVYGLLMDGGTGALRALLKRAGIGEKVRPLMVTAIQVYRELCKESLTDDYRKLRRTMIERVMTRYETMTDADSEQILALLHRYAADAARDEARRARSDSRTDTTLQIAA